MHIKQQVIVIEMESFNPCSAESDVPLGSVLRPLAFFCHINGIPHRVTAIVRLLADDCLLHRPIHSPCGQLLLQQDIATLEAWAAD